MSALNGLTFLSVDVETSTKVAGMGELLTVGIVPVIYAHPGGWRMVDSVDQLYLRIEHTVSHDTRYHPSVDSLAWWSEQDEFVRREAFDQSLLRFPKHTAAKMIAEHVRSIEDDPQKVIFAANPVSFDKPWVDMLLARVNLELPWHYRSLCLRSMKFGMDVEAGFGSDRTTHQSTVPHHALHDAQAQAQDLIDMLNAGLEVVV